MDGGDGGDPAAAAGDGDDPDATAGCAHTVGHVGQTGATVGVAGVEARAVVLHVHGHVRGVTAAIDAYGRVQASIALGQSGYIDTPLPTALLALPFGILATMGLVLFTDRMVDPRFNGAA